MNKWMVIVVLLVVATEIIIGSRNDSRGQVSCDQYKGPFSNINQATVSKENVREQLLDFYGLCLAPEYKNGYLTESSNQNSESESYALLQSYLANDKTTFSVVLDFVNHNLQHKDDNLFSWKFEVRNKFLGSPQVNILDPNSATDADTDIAYVLLRAGTDWGNPSYINEGNSIAKDIWNKETAVVRDKRYVVAGNWVATAQQIVINPSYFSPQAYRTFALFDGDHNWNKLLADNYELLAKVANHGASQPVVPPNWVAINRTTGSLEKYSDKPMSADFGYDAFRTFWRVAEVFLLLPSQSSRQFLSSATSFATDWQGNESLCALYVYKNGNYVCDKSTTSTLAAPLAIFSATNSTDAAQLVQKYYINHGKLQFPDTDFYAKSWHWFGTWLWTHS